MRLRRAGGPSGRVLETVDGVLVPGGFGIRGSRARSRRSASPASAAPYLGICLGLQTAVIEVARNLAGLRANSSEFEADTPYPVIDLLPDQRRVADKGGTMRLGLDPCRLLKGSRAERLRRRAGVRAAPPPLRGQQPLPAPAGGRRAGLLRDLARRPPGRDDRAARPPVVRGRPVPPRVPLPPDPAPPPVPGLRGAATVFADDRDRSAPAPAPGVRADGVPAHRNGESTLAQVPAANARARGRARADPAPDLDPARSDGLADPVRHDDDPPVPAGPVAAGEPGRPGGRWPPAVPGRRPPAAVRGQGGHGPDRPDRHEDGRTSEREVVEHNGAVAALVVDDDGQVLLVDQWRHAVGARVLEVAAGKYDVRGERSSTPSAASWPRSWGRGRHPDLAGQLLDDPGMERRGARPVPGRGRHPDRGRAASRPTGRSRASRRGCRTTRRPRAAGPPGDAKTLVALGLYGLMQAGRWTPDQADRPPPDAPPAGRPTGLTDPALPVS